MIKYTIETKNGAIEVIDPFMICDTSVYRDHKNDNNYIRIVKDVETNEIIDIPKENVLCIKSIEI